MATPPPLPDQAGIEANRKVEEERIAAAKAAEEEKVRQAAAKEAEAKAEKERQAAEAEKSRQEAEAKAEKERQAAEAEKARQEAEAKAEKERQAAEAEKARQEAEAKAEKERQAAEAEKARQEAEAKAEQERQVAEAEKSRQEAEAKAEKARQEAEAEKARQEAEAKAEKERQAAEAEKARQEAEAKAEQERQVAEAEKSRQEAEAKAEKERQAAEAEKSRQEAEAKAEKARQEAEAKADEERQAKAAADAKAAEEKEHAAAAAAVAAQVKEAGEKAEKDRQAAAKAAEDRANQEQRAAEKAAHEKAEQEKIAAIKAADHSKKRQAEVPETAVKAQAAATGSPLPTAPISELPAVSSEAMPGTREIPEPVAAEPTAASSAIAAGGDDEGGEKLEDIEAVAEPKKEKAKRKIPTMPLVAMVVLLAIAGAAVLVVPKLLKKPAEQIVEDQSAAAAQKEEEYLKTGWEADARRVLGDFLAAETAAGKASNAIRGGELLGEMEVYYGDGGIDDSGTPVSAFSVYPLNMKDKKRGIFMLTYDQPPAFELSEYFVPLAPLQVKYQLREPDMLLASVGRSNNFTAESLQVHALFKRSEDGLKIDWETFVQTKYRTLRDFLELPEPGAKKVFRVIVSETVPEKRNAPAGHRTYLIADPAHRMDDSARVYVAGDSSIGRAFSILNWRGTKDGRVMAKTATLELAWSKEATPRLSVSRFICWEFLGIGGEAVEP